MNTKQKGIFISTLLVFLIFAVVVAIHAQQSAGVQLVQPGADIVSGKPLVLEVRLDKPLQADSSVIARVRPEGATAQTIQLESSTPDDSSRNKFTLKTVMPPSVVPGKWRLENVFITLPGSINWQVLNSNQLTFDVKGTPLEVPSKAEVTVAH
ncbi:MAG: hypothetical protein WCC04_01990 [Terriglobales bacterium]